jgi:hypothetical protein
MARIAALLTAALPVAFAAVLLLLPVAVPVAQAESLACQTVNGQTTCMRGSGSLSCQTVNGQTLCNQGPLNCRTVNKRTVCSTDPNDSPSAEAVPQLPPDLKGFMDEDVTVKQENGKLRVRAGGVDVRIE